jgi:hypothetical protein
LEFKLHLLVLVAVQAAASAAPLRIDLTVPPPCGAQRAASDEIVVCANGSSPYRINQQPARQPDLPKAEVQIADGVLASADTEQADVGGFPSNRVVVRLKFKF